MMCEREGYKEKGMEVGEDRSNEYYYKECLRNHAASLGSYATDGCGEFIPSGTSGPLQCAIGGNLQCAACGCHRNFHRRVTVSNCGVSCSRLGDGSQRQNQMAVESEWEIRSPKKRMRTKFSVEQKEKMFEFAEKLGWKMHRGKEEGNEIEGFCRGIGVSKKVFNVWMHNHKNNPTYSSST